MTKIKTSRANAAFNVFNLFALITLSFLCLVPFINVLAISLSNKQAVVKGIVYLWPVNTNLEAYKFLLNKTEFWRAMTISFKRIALGGVINMLLTVLVAYPLSKSSRDFPSRTFYAWFMLFTILFSGGMIPSYLVVRSTGLIDSIWALVIPGAVDVFLCVLLMNFFRQLPRDMEEAAFIDGAGHLTTLWHIYIPVSKPALATILLFVLVGHWNSWFDGLLYMNRVEHYPLQTYMQTIFISQVVKVSNADELKLMMAMSNKTILSAQVLIGMIPIMAVYPFLQKYFTKGIVLGSVKG